MNVDDVEGTMEDSAAFSECEVLPAAASAAPEDANPEKTACQRDPGEDRYEFRGVRGCLLQCSIRYAYCRDRALADRVYMHSRAGDGGCYQHYWRCTRGCYSDRSLRLAEQEEAD